MTTELPPANGFSLTPRGLTPGDLNHRPARDFAAPRNLPLGGLDLTNGQVVFEAHKLTAVGELATVDSHHSCDTQAASAVDGQTTRNGYTRGDAQRSCAVSGSNFPDSHSRVDAQLPGAVGDRTAIGQWRHVSQQSTAYGPNFTPNQPCSGTHMPRVGGEV